MKVVRYATPTDFWHAAGPLLTADPIRNTVALTVLAHLLSGGDYGGARPVFLTVEDDGRLIGAAFCTPPFPLNVSALPAELAPLVADHLLAAGIAPNGVNGMRPEAEAFAASWAQRTGAGRAGHMDQRLYRLDVFAPPAGVVGEPALATTDDLDLLADWRIAFREEAEQHSGRAGNRDSVTRGLRDSIAAGNAHVLWRVDGRPVSLASANAPVSGMSRVGPVYTPERFRKHGYGCAVTAAVTRWALDRGAEEVLLFTDLSNPVSNSIYQRIGFVPVADALDVTFTPVRLP